jgi:hypothetical protein
MKAGNRPSSEYHFVSIWRVEGTAAEVYAIIEDVESLPRWWPAVYLEVRVLEPGDAAGVGKVVALYTKGWLPYTLRWQLRIIEAQRPHRSTLEAWGDLIGRGVWTFTQAGGKVQVQYDWRIQADKPMLRYLSFLLKPIFAANHRWAMARGEESLRLELLRRRADSATGVVPIPDPPGPTFPHRRRRDS